MASSNPIVTPSQVTVNTNNTSTPERVNNISSNFTSDEKKEISRLLLKNYQVLLSKIKTEYFKNKPKLNKNLSLLELKKSEGRKIPIVPEIILFKK